MTTNGEDDKLQEYSTIEEFKEKHVSDLSSCLTDLTCLHSSAVEKYINEIIASAEQSFKQKPPDHVNQTFHMRKLSIAIEPGAVESSPDINSSVVSVVYQ